MQPTERKITAIAHWDANVVRLHLSATEAGQLSVVHDGDFRRANASLTVKQAVALAYKLLHAANDATKEQTPIDEEA